MQPDEFRQAAHELVDWLAAYRTHTAELPVSSRVEPGSVRAQLPPTAPEEPESFAALVADLEHIIMPGISHWQHPRFFGYFPANASLASVLGDLVSSGLGQLGLNWQASPALTELEEQMCLWMRELLGLSPAWQGVIQDTASTATLVALICARERLTSYGATRGGLQAEELPLIVYCSGQSHSSVEKAALLAGFGRTNLRPIATDGEHAMRPDLLAAAVTADLAAGYRPCAVVATTGTTATTGLDPIAAIAEVCRQHGLWLHVDAAMAGSAMILPECRWMWDGIEMADSLVLNPHKWLGVVFDCSLYYVRDAQHLIRVMSTNPSYLQTKADGAVINYRDWGIPLGRRMRAMKLWFMLRLEGAAALRTRLRRDIELAQWFAAQVDASANWVRLNPVHLQTICIRHEPPGVEGEDLDRHTLEWIGRINTSGVALLTPAVLDGRWMCRVSLGAETTSHEDVAHLWVALREAVE
ncbi:MAG: aspartate aminotransferase family protein [Candidatus Viridilinea halotolerans]|uniref:Aspartate aminotransferase family protein n=1 Tax=Candidatus Viridilinea halotolerans TaxID=2491704 RepID=A0A426U699_9CHLR|nr:MAG: aspartate aminotransferase family protein [Candidatus Viridilinea halotolerans]